MAENNEQQQAHEADLKASSDSEHRADNVTEAQVQQLNTCDSHDAPEQQQPEEQLSLVNPFSPPPPEEGEQSSDPEETVQREENKQAPQDENKQAPQDENKQTGQEQLAAAAASVAVKQEYEQVSAAQESSSSQQQNVEEPPPPPPPVSRRVAPARLLFVNTNFSGDEDDHSNEQEDTEPVVAPHEHTTALPHAAAAAAAASQLDVRLRVEKALQEQQSDLDLSNQNLGNEHIQQLCEELKGNKSIVKLDLSKNAFNESAAPFLANLITLDTKLETLLLEGNQIYDSGAQLILDALFSNKTLTDISFTERFVADGILDEIDTILDANFNRKKKANTVAPTPPPIFFKNYDDD